jgi:uncharacterized membrane protein YqhA
MPSAIKRAPARTDGESPLARLIGRSRLIVFVAVVAVLLCAVSLFLLGAVLAADTVWSAWRDVFQGRIDSSTLTVRFLEIVSVMLKAVFFYLIGVGFYSLFIAPLNLTVALGMETLNDLETKIISVIIVIMAVRFLERFMSGGAGPDLLYEAGALALVTAALVFFKIFAHREGQEHKRQHPDIQERAKRDMFDGAQERHDITEEEIETRADRAERPRGARA